MVWKNWYNHAYLLIMRTKINELTPIELKTKLIEDTDFTLIDVREPEEFEVCHINGSILIPLTEITDHLPDFNAKLEYVIVCKEGTRSKEAIKIMRKLGFENLHNLNGGILSWAKSVEQTMELY